MNGLLKTLVLASVLASTGCALTVARDTDGDGVDDSFDACFNTRLGEPVDRDGCSTLDDDGDGVLNDDDACRREFGVLANGCNAVPADSDGDGIVDSEDACPTVFGTGADGCPPPAQADTYEECSRDDDCFSSDYCQPISSSTADAAICSQSCFDNRDCPTTNSGFEGVCLPLATVDACVESCGDDFDCAAGFTCEVEQLTGFDYLICVPR